MSLTMMIHDVTDLIVRKPEKGHSALSGEYWSQTIAFKTEGREFTLHLFLKGKQEDSENAIND